MPTISTPFGILPPSFWNLAGSFRKSTISRDFLLRLVDARDVRERDVDLVFAQQPRAALAERHRAAAAGAALHLAHEVDQHEDQQQDRERGDEELEQEVLALRRRRFDLDLGLSSRPISAVLSVSGL